jgi:glycosyltransferase involved in cell wall biosynthesis
VAVLPPIIPSEFDITNFESRVNVGFIGRLDPRKGGRKLIDFMIQNPELNFDVSYIKHEGDLGVLELEEELTKLCKNSSLVPQGMYTRKVDTDVVKNLNKSAIFLQFYETLDSTVDLPLLLLEALACGCKVYTNVYFKELDEHSLLISMSHKSSEGIVSQEEINETTLDMRLESSSFVRSRFHYVRIMKILIGELYA